MSLFDGKVWSIIRAIPPGEVMTYGEVARRIGTRAFRAVGGACNRSPGMPDVPCHRVVDARMRLRGFSGGIEKKRRLLEGEGVMLDPCVSRGRPDYRVVAMDGSDSRRDACTT